MSEAQLLDLWRRLGVLLEGHLLLTSGRHSTGFFLFARLMQWPRHLQAAARQLATPLEGMGVQTVMGPAMGGVILAYEIARVLGVRAVYTEKEPDGTMALRRGFDLGAGERILVVEDAVTTGGSLLRCLEVARAAGAEVVAVAALLDRRDATVDFGAPFHALVRRALPVYEPAQCPLCRRGVPVVRPKAGHCDATPAVL